PAPAPPPPRGRSAHRPHRPLRANLRGGRHHARAARGRARPPRRGRLPHRRRHSRARRPRVSRGRRPRAGRGPARHVFGSRGSGGVVHPRGYGAMRLLDAVDYDLIRRHPKVFIGYSDITALHLALHHRAGLVTFHGPMAAAIAAGGEHDLGQLLRAVTRPHPLGPLANPPDGPEIETLVPGTADGVLLGGNAAVLTSLLGTPYLPSFEGAVLFLEDILDHTYRLDRKIVQLRLTGVLEQVAGIVVGECRLRAEPGDQGLSIRQILEDLVVPLGKPAMYGLACGHGAYHLTLPVGVRAHLDAGRGVLSINEAAVT